MLASDRPADTAKTESTSRFVWLSVAGVIAMTLLQVVVLSLTSLPLGVPGEWTWPRIDEASPQIIELIVASVLLAALGGLTFWGLRFFREERKDDRVIRAGCLAGMVVLAFLMIGAVRSIPIGIHGTAGTTWVTYYPRMSGYYTEAMKEDRSTGEFLAGYEQVVREGDFLHQGTHPPGLILYFRGLKGLCRTFPALTSRILAMESPALSEGLNVLDQLSNAGPFAFGRIDRAVLVLNLWVTEFLAALTVVPIALLVSRFWGLGAGWLSAGFWPLVPALALFLPKSDLLLPVFGTTTVLLWILAVQKRSFVSAFLAGVVLWLGLMISLALLVVPVILSAYMMASLPARGCKVFGPERASIRRLAGGMSPALIVTAGAGVILPCMILWGLTDANLFTIWWLNLQNHAAFYDHNPRTWWKWLGVNPFELAFGLGPAVSILAFGSLVLAVRSRLRSEGEAFIVGVVAVWALLWLSGKNMGEAARLWIFLMPLFVACGGLLFARLQACTGNRGLVRSWGIYLLCQFAVVVVTVSGIDGFDFSTFLK
ncbi:hypothetical protein [Rubinisphaera margarita]|uniref:hypothetical protein n=1 Tax=Rubinisphaera margarita TaxID=2909586 RepID=UPI001EE97ABB|nr:hypothetical protein [Rubinisphaera margarita]MCG6154709.1 hypothetical protein [Rubinisphaera margarita]